MKKLFYTFLLVMGMVILLSGNDTYQTKDWLAPKEADSLSNPVKGNLEATKAGKKLFDKLCVVCHGTKGKGDGMAGMTLKPRPTNLTSSNVQQQTDGAIYWKITKGRAPMASYEYAISESDRWQLVNYIRALGK